MILKDRLKFDIVSPFFLHLSLTGRAREFNRLKKLSDEDFDKEIKMLVSGEISYSDF